MLEKWFQTDSQNEESVFHQGLYPGGQTEEWVPNKHRWAPPEGTLALENDVLRKALTDCNNITEKQDFQVNVVNKIMLHTCSRYCLIRKTVSVNENNPHSDGRPPEEKESCKGMQNELWTVQ